MSAADALPTDVILLPVAGSSTSSEPPAALRHSAPNTRPSQVFSTRNFGAGTFMAFILPARRFCLNARGGAPSRDIYLDIPNCGAPNNTRGQRHGPSHPAPRGAPHDASVAGTPLRGRGTARLARWGGRPFHHAELVIRPGTSGRIRWHGSLPPRCGEERKFVLAARFFASELWLTTNCQATKQIGASGGSCFVLEPPLIDSLPARMIPKSGLPVFGRGHAQEKEAERRQTQGCAARTQAACGTRHGERRLAPPSACGRARLLAFHYGSHQRDFRPKGSASGQASRKRRKSCRLSRTRPLGHSEAPRAPVLVPAGMMPELPGCGPYPSARGHRTRSAVREYPRLTASFKSETGAVIVIGAGKSNGLHFLQ